MRQIPVLLAAAVLLLGGAGCRTPAPDAQSAAPAPPAPAATHDVADPAALLRAWDVRRSRAYAAGDARALRALYLPGARAGRHDVTMLRRYAARGLRVVDLRTQVLAVEVLRRHDRHLALAVTDRVVGGAAVGRGSRVRLPDGAPRERAVSLVRRGDRWLVGAVRLTDDE